MEIAAVDAELADAAGIAFCDAVLGRIGALRSCEERKRGLNRNRRYR
jgi:hypothetical protein